MTEKAVRKNLGIKNYDTYFAETENRKSFAHLIPIMDKKFAMRMVRNFPILLSYVDSSLVTAQGILKDMYEADKESFLPIYENYSKIIDVCLDKCNDSHITSEQQMEYMDRAIEVGKLAAQKDTENKRFKWLNLNTVLGFVGGITVAGALLLSSRNTGISEQLEESEDENNDIIDIDPADSNEEFFS